MLFFMFARSPRVRGLTAIAAFVALALAAGSPLSAQPSPLVWATDLSAGVFLPTGDLGTVGVTQGRMRQAAVLTAAVHLGHPRSPFGAYLATTQALHGGIRVTPTEDCRLNCQARTLDHGRLWTLTAGITTTLALGSTEVRALLGGGIRTHATLGKVLVTGVPQPGEFWPSAFLNPIGGFGAHLGVQVAQRVGRQAVFVRLDDFMGRSDVRTYPGDPPILHDLTLNVGLRVPW